METVSEALDDSSGTNPSSVKSENGSPPPDGERGSPPPNCAICLGKCRNKSFTDSCLHQFCFKCLVSWSKVKTECPLCKQNFKSIIHNVQSNQQYEEYRVEQEEDRIDIDDLVTATRRFRYRTTLTFPRAEQLAFHRLLMRYPPLSAMVDLSRELPAITAASLPPSRRRGSPNSFRRTVYRHNLWARPLPDFTGRHRDCTPEFYRYNSSQIHRLMPWLSRELSYLLFENSGHIAYVLTRILELLPQYHITSPEFRGEMYHFFGTRTDHFLHELHCFASTPYDLNGYDRCVQYTTDSRVYVNTVNDISSSDSDSADSDVVEVFDAARNRQPSVELLSAIDGQNAPHPAFRPVTPTIRTLPTPFTSGPSTTTLITVEPVYPLNLITSPTDGNRLCQSVIPIETISNTDSDEDEVMVTGYIKPPHQRTPVVVDLRDSDSDSDVVVTETSPPAPRFPVMLKLSRPRAASPPDNDDETYTPPQPPSQPPLPPPQPIKRRRSMSGNFDLSRFFGKSYSDSTSYSSSTSSCDEEIPQGNTDIQKKGKDRARNRKSRFLLARRKHKHSREVQRMDVASASTSVASTSATAGSSANDRSSPDREHHEMSLQRKSINGKGVKSSRRNEPTIDSTKPVTISEWLAREDEERFRHNVMNLGSKKPRESTRTMQHQEEPQPGPSSRPAERETMPRRDEALELPKESLNNTDSSRSSSKVGKSSRLDKTSQYKRAKYRTTEKPEASLAQIRKELKQRQKDDGDESMNVNDEPQPGPSSRPDLKIKSSRRDATSKSRMAEYRTESESSSRPRSKGKTSRRDESIESPSGSSSRSSGHVTQRDLPSEMRGARSGSVHDEMRRESSTRHGEKRAKSSKMDPSETRKRERSTDELRSDARRSSGKAAKSSRRDKSPESRASPSDAQPGPSQAGPSNSKKQSSDEIPIRHEYKKLKSVVKKASGFRTSVPSSVTQVPNVSKNPPLSPDSFSDSDDIPLNLTIHRSAGH